MHLILRSRSVQHRSLNESTAVESLGNFYRPCPRRPVGGTAGTALVSVTPSFLLLFLIPQVACYHYPYFGTSAPVRTSLVWVPPRMDTPLANSCCSFSFGMSLDRLSATVQDRPLVRYDTASLYSAADSAPCELYVDRTTSAPPFFEMLVALRRPSLCVEIPCCLKVICTIRTSDIRGPWQNALTLCSIVNTASSPFRSRSSIALPVARYPVCLLEHTRG